MPIRILIVDDSEIVRKGLRNILRIKPDWEVCGEAPDGLGAIELFKSLDPDVVIMDFQMPGVNGMDAAARILQIDPIAKIVLFTQHASPALEQRALDVGIRFVISKTDTTQMVGKIAELVMPENSEPRTGI